MGSILKHGSNRFRIIFEGNMDSLKYVSILEYNIIKLKRCSKWILQLDHDSSINQMSHWNFILKIK